MMMCRYIQSSQTDLPGPANAELRLREERLSRRVCSACCRPFSLLTNRCDIYTISIVSTISTLYITISSGGCSAPAACSECAGPVPLSSLGTRCGCADAAPPPGMG